MRAQTCMLPLFCGNDLEINPLTLKLEGDRDILKMYFTLKMKLLAEGLQNKSLNSENSQNMSQGQKSRSKWQKL